MSEPLETDPSLLAVVLDINARAWSDSPLALENALQQITIFLNAYLALKQENRLVVLAASKKECRCLYPVDRARAASLPNIQVYEQFRMVDACLLSGVQSMLSGAESEVTDMNRGIEESQSLISRALSMALCHIHKISEASKSYKVWSRILMLSAADDSPREYIALMNSIFAAQKLNVLIDICKIFGQDSVFLQQAADITGGNYLKVNTANNNESLLQTLMFSCLADHYTRDILYLPNNELIDFRTACFCHRKVVDVGFVCSVCLSIFCKMAPVCSTCHTKFSFKIVRQSSASQTNGSSQNSTNGTVKPATNALSSLSLAPAQ
ncbi:RNA polymerase II transcription factor B subunit 4 [Coemansia sp. RSA 1813]|nr:RNA polymerase II transcription factor B subunit 4 [Coemansia sp. RSA 1646]KAJ1772496.1 RNA polymerase II transcription factor B subunit 4 [Coemansia sp. RSA 1843]KAJ2090898.1 RNA polymerase II transcription factor B subunit 4 [Coemansia sp. RSA 986]KAJ2214032.1 RNA polymerase II transcription factor B subunit 4 [Coemansia sp. RSA 487]KAJ2571273.1 RNA polymerase II transcription factor B subunit 4 [Coemansia sp. RSA 1813]